MLDELIKTDFSNFEKNIKILPKLYHCTTKEGKDGISLNGACREFTGKNSNFYGQGFYTTFTLDSTVDNSSSIYGKYIIKFALNDGFKDFLFCDEEMNQKYNNGESIESQIERLCPPDVIEVLKQKNFFSRIQQDKGTHSRLNKKLSAHIAKCFFEALKGERLPSKLLTPWQREQGCNLYDEKLISKTKIRGYIFVGGNDGEVCVVRDFNSLIPIAYFDPTIGDDPTNDSDKGWINIYNQETFNGIANSVDIGTHIRGEYPETPLNTKTICGYVLVKGKPSGKYNYLNTSTMQELLPIPADYATDFDNHTMKAKFVINGEEYEYSAKNNLFIEDGCFTYNKDEFIEELKENGLLNESIINKVHSLINRINNL